jgi:hypothetical protein
MKIVRIIARLNVGGPGASRRLADEGTERRRRIQVGF